MQRAGIFLKRIFHPSDFSPASDLAFAHALRLAVAGQGHLTILHTGGNRHDPHWEEFPQVRATLESWGLLPQNSDRLAVGDLGLDVRKVSSPNSEPVSAILHYLEHHPHDLIVLATHQYDGFARIFHKSVASPVALGSGALTLFLPQQVNGFVNASDGSLSLRRILVPVDADPRPQLAITGAAAVAGLLRCEEVTFTLFHVGPEASFPALPPAPEEPGWRWQRATASGRVEQAILNAAQEYGADLIVMATAGHHGFLDALRGSTTERIVRAAQCPVLAVPAYEKATVMEEALLINTVA